MSLAGSAAVITGAASGIGLACTRKLLSSGVSKLIAVDFTDKLGPAVADLQSEFPEATVISHHADVTDAPAFAAAFEHLGAGEPLAVVANHAGIGGEADWEKTIAVNLSAAIVGTQLGMKHFGSGGGVVINTSSMAGLFPMSFGPV